MKKWIISTLGVLASVCCVLGAASCADTGELLDAELDEYEYMYTPVFEDKYDSDMTIDGVLDEARWDNKKWLEHAGKTADVKYTTAFSEYGVYVACVAYDKDITWYGRFDMTNNSGFTIHMTLSDNTEKSNTKVLRMQTDAYDRRSYFQSRFSAATTVDGVVDSGETEKMTMEMFVSWKALGLTENDMLDTEDIPQDVKIEPVYRKILKEIGRKRTRYNIYPTFTETAHEFMWSYPRFGNDGYVNADAEGAKMGMAKNGIAKTDGWDVSALATDGTVRSNTIGQQAIFFKDVDSENFVAEATLTINKPLSASSPKVGMIVSQSYDDFRAVTISQSVIANKKLIVNAQTYHPNRVNQESKVYEEEGYEFGDTIKFEYIKYGKLLIVRVDGKIVYTDKQDWYEGKFSPGVFAYNTDCSFSNLSAQEMTAEEMLEYLTETKGISPISVSPSAGGTVTLNTNAVAAGEEFVLTVNPTLGYMLKDLKLNGTSIYDDFCENVQDGKLTIKTAEAAGVQNVEATFERFANNDTNRSAYLKGKFISSKSNIPISGAEIKITSSYPYLYYNTATSSTGGYLFNALPLKGVTLPNGQEADGKYTITVSALYFETYSYTIELTSASKPLEEDHVMTDQRGLTISYQVPTIITSAGNSVQFAPKTAEETLPAMLQYSTNADIATATDSLDQFVHVLIKPTQTDFSEFVSLKYTIYEENSTARILPVLWDSDGTAWGIGGSKIKEITASRAPGYGDPETRDTGNTVEGFSIAGNAYATYTVSMETGYLFGSQKLASSNSELNSSAISYLSITMYAKKANVWTVSFGDIYGVKENGTEVKVFDSTQAKVLTTETYITSGTNPNTSLGDMNANEAKLIYLSSAKNNYQSLSIAAARTVKVDKGTRDDMWQFGVVDDSADIFQATGTLSNTNERIDLTYHDAVYFEVDTTEMSAGKQLKFNIELRCGSNDVSKPRVKTMYLLNEDGSLYQKIEASTTGSNWYVNIEAKFKGKAVVLFEDFDVNNSRLSSYITDVDNKIRFVYNIVGMDGELFKINNVQFISTGASLVENAQSSAQ